MLCIGVYILWILPIKFTIINPFLVALGCCLVLYLVAVEVNEKKALYKKINNKNIYTMQDVEFFEYCKSKGMSDYDITIADTIFRKHIKGNELYKKLGYSKRQTLRIRKKLHEKLTT